MRRVLLAAFLLMALLPAVWLGMLRSREYRASVLAIRWDASTRVFDWGPASVRLPTGLTHERLRGIETMMGELLSRDGRVIIGYDIGELASEHGGIGAFTESLRAGSRVRLARSGEGAWFPDNGCARFYLACESREGLAAIRTIARSFHPRNRLPALLVPLLPEPIRKDCRYRFPDFGLF